MHCTYNSRIEGAESEEGLDQQGQKDGPEDSGGHSTADKKLQMLYIQMEFCPRTLKARSPSDKGLCVLRAPSKDWKTGYGGQNAHLNIS